MAVWRFGSAMWHWWTWMNIWNFFLWKGGTILLDCPVQIIRYSSNSFCQTLTSFWIFLTRGNTNFENFSISQSLKISTCPQYHLKLLGRLFWVRNKNSLEYLSYSQKPVKYHVEYQQFFFTAALKYWIVSQHIEQVIFFLLAAIISYIFIDLLRFSLYIVIINNP